jgi:hypothetical protein
MDPSTPAPINGYALGGLFWTIAYLSIINRGFRDKTFGMPVLALCICVGWEFLGVTLRIVPEAFYPTLVWLPLDLVMFSQALIYGRADFQHPFVKKYFYPIVLSTLVYSTLVIYAFELKFNDRFRYYSGYNNNVLISTLYIAMLLRRGSSRGQSIYMALSKTIGTCFIFAEFLRDGREPDKLLVSLELSGVLVLDTIYATLLYKKLKEEGTPIWRRF